MCNKLLRIIKDDISSLHHQKAPSWFMNEHINDLNTGDAVICNNCDKYKECFPVE